MNKISSHLVAGNRLLTGEEDLTPREASEIGVTLNEVRNETRAGARAAVAPEETEIPEKC